MLVSCPHCAKQLKLNEKIQESLRQLEDGRRIKVKCVHCAEPFALDRNSVKPKASPSNKGQSVKTGQNDNANVRPPAPPSIDWLREGTFEDKEVVEDIPRALVLLPEIPARDIVVKAAGEFGYLVEQVDSPEEAIDKMRFVNYAAVFLHSHYESGGINTGKFHHYMRQMNMARRRYIFYVLIGEQFETLYDVQALAFSANLVVGDAETEYIATLLRKTIPEYEALFGPIMEELRIAGN